MINKVKLEDEIDLLGYWRVLVKRRKLIGAIVGIATIASVIISLLLPKIYASTASILPPQQQDSLGLGIMSRLPENLSGFAGGVLGTKTPADLWVGILKSRSVKDAIIARFKLRELYNTDAIEDTRQKLNEVVTIEKSKKEEIISITVEDKDPKRATEMANAFVEELDRINKNITMTSGGRVRAFVDKRLGEAKQELMKVEEAVKTFQELNKAIKLDAQSKAIMEAIGTVKGQLMAREVELQTLLSFATQNNPQVELLKSQVDELSKKLRELEEGEKESGPSAKGIFFPTSKFPDLTLQYARLVREAKIQETLFDLLTQQYEMARIQEAKDSPTVQVLDVAKVPEKKAKPNRRLIVIFSIVTSGISAIFVVFFLEFLQREKIKGSDETVRRTGERGVSTEREEVLERDPMEVLSGREPR